MSLLAGFDLVVEISNATLLKGIESQFQIGSVPAKPPFEITIPLSNSGITGTAHFIVAGMQLDLNADETVALTFAFDRGSIEIDSPIFSTDICPLDGTVVVQADIAVQIGADQIATIVFNIVNAKITWSDAANQAISNSLGALGALIDTATFDTLANQAIQSYVASQPAPTFPLAIKVTPGTNGSLMPALVFERLEVHCISNPARSQQALALFGTLLAQNDAHGNHANKTATAITSLQNGMCISISPQAFDRFVFCPGLASASVLNATVPMLPHSCGVAAGLDTQGITITSLTDAFANGHIDIIGAATKSGFCYTANATFHSTLTLSVSGGALKAAVSTDPPNIAVVIPWYCQVAATVLGGPLVIAFNAALGPIVNAGSGVINLGSTLSGSLSLNGLSASTLGPTVTLSDVAVTVEGITLQGIVFQPAATPGQPAIDLAGSVTTNSSTVMSSGVFTTKLWCVSAPKNYPYTENSQQQQGTYSAIGTLVQEPLSIAAYVSSGQGPYIPLNGAAGTIEVPDVETHYPMPLATGGSVIRQAVHIDHQISGPSIVLNNRPEEGNYGIWLKVVAMGCGQPVMVWGQPLQQSTWVQFEGDHVDIGGRYDADVQQCAMSMSRFIQGINANRAWQQVPIWVEINYPPPDKLVSYVQQLMALGHTELDEVLRQVKIAHGNSFTRAMLSPAATQIATGTAER